LSVYKLLTYKSLIVNKIYVIDLFKSLRINILRYNSPGYVYKHDSQGKRVKVNLDLSVYM